MASNPFGQDPYGHEYDVETTYIPPEEIDVHDTVVPAVPAAPNPSGPTHLAAPPPAVYVPVQQTPQPPLQFADSNFNTNVSGNMGSGPRTASTTAKDDRPLLGAGATSSAPVGGGGSVAGAAQSDQSYPFYNVRRYRQYFDIDTKDVVLRVANSCLGPFRADFMEKTADTPDLYGPFWVATTLIFVTAVAGNYANYLQWHQQQSSSSTTQKQWYSDYGKMSWSAALFYGYTFVLGLGLFFALRWFKSDIKLANVWCIFGYSIAVFIPISFICIVPLEWVRWLVLSIATLSSGLSLILNLKTAIYAAAPARATALLAGVAACHLLLGLALKLYFFRYS